MDESDDDGNTPIRKKRRKIDEDDEKLGLVEGQQSDFLNDGGGGLPSSVASVSCSEGDDLSSDVEGSTWVDAMDREKFDLTNSMLREKLSHKSKKLGDGRVAKELEIVDAMRGKLSKKLGNRREIKKVLELEVVDNRDEKAVVHLMNEQGKYLLGDGLSNTNNNENSGRNGSKEINERMFRGFGGMDGVTGELMRKVILPFYYPQLPRHLGVKPITGILLHGPPGCGKTTLAEAIANETGVPFYKISAAELVSGVSGASEENIRELFSKANRTAPSIVFIDEIDAIASKRENLRGMELRIVTQLITCMDESRNLVKLVHNNASSRSSFCRPGYVLMIGATNRPDALDPALRRPGRFDREIVLGVPDEYARVQILSKLTCNVKVEGALDLVKIARSTTGFVGADLEALVDEAGSLAMDKIIGKRKVELSEEQKDGAHSEDCWWPSVSDEEVENLSITMADFEEAVKMVPPSSKREGFSDVPNVKCDDVGGLHLLRQEFARHIIWRIKFSEVYKVDALTTRRGKEGGWVVERLLNQARSCGSCIAPTRKVREACVCSSP